MKWYINVYEVGGEVVWGGIWPNRDGLSKHACEGPGRKLLYRLIITPKAR